MLETEDDRNSFIKSLESVLILCVIFYAAGQAIIFISRFLTRKPWIAPSTVSAIWIGLTPLWLIFSIASFFESNTTGFYDEGCAHYFGWLAITIVVCYGGVGLYSAEMARVE